MSDRPSPRVRGRLLQGLVVVLSLFVLSGGLPLGQVPEASAEAGSQEIPGFPPPPLEAEEREPVAAPKPDSDITEKALSVNRPARRNLTRTGDLLEV
jgi:hypothetical protein